MFYLIKKNFKDLMHVCGIYVLWITMHYLCAHLYVYLCVPYTWTGFIMSPIHSPMPHCAALRYVIYYGGENINKMWFLLGIWVCRKITTNNE